MCGQCQSRGNNCVYATTLKWASPGSISSLKEALRKKEKRGQPGRRLRSTSQRDSSASNEDDVESVPNGAKAENDEEEPLYRLLDPTGDEAPSGLPVHPGDAASTFGHSPHVSPQVTSLQGPERVESEVPLADVPIPQSEDGATPRYQAGPNLASPIQDRREDGTASVSGTSVSFHEIASPNGFSAWVSRAQRESLVTLTCPKEGEPFLALLVLRVATKAHILSWHGCG